MSLYLDKHSNYAHRAHQLIALVTLATSPQLPALADTLQLQQTTAGLTNTVGNVLGRTTNTVNNVGNGILHSVNNSNPVGPIIQGATGAVPTQLIPAGVVPALSGSSTFPAVPTLSTMPAHQVPSITSNVSSATGSVITNTSHAAKYLSGPAAVTINGASNQIPATLASPLPQIWSAPADKMPGLQLLSSDAAMSLTSKTGNSPARLIGPADVIGKLGDPGKFTLQSGSALLVVKNSPGAVTTPLGTVSVNRPSDVLIQLTDGILRVQNLDGAHNGVIVRLPDKAEPVALRPGYELVASNSPITREGLMPLDAVARRNTVISNDGRLAVSEVHLGSVVRNQIKKLRNIAPEAVEQTVNRVLKTAAIMDLTRGVTGFVTSLLPPVQVPPPIILPPITPPVTPPVPPPVIPPAPPPVVNPAGTTASASTQAEQASVQSAASASNLNIANSVVLAQVAPPNFDATKNLDRPNREQIQPPLPPIARPPVSSKPRSGTEIANAASPAARVPEKVESAQNEHPAAPVSLVASAPSTDIAAQNRAVTREKKAAPRNNAFKPNSTAQKKTHRGHVTPADEVFETVRETVRRFPELAIAVLVLIAGLLLLSLMLARSAMIRAREVQAMNDRLEKEINERKSVEQKVSALNADLEHKVAELEILNQELQAAKDQAVEGSRLKSQFVANISHEIRTPITAVIGMNQLLMASALQPKQREYARLVNESAQSLLSIINDILDFSKIEAGMMELNFSSFAAETLLKEVADVVSSAVRQKDLLFLTSVTSGVPLKLNGDPQRLRQVLVNLAANAIKFTPRGEVLVQVTMSPQNPDFVRFSVADTGIGIAEQAQSKLFQAFVQADGTTTRKFGGTGLGLSISKRLVELMGGEIQLISSEGKGSTFFFDVPLKMENTADAVSSETPSDVYVTPQSWNGKRIFICSERQLTNDVLKEHLANAGFEVTIGTMEDLSKMIESYMSNNWFDLVMVDAATSGVCVRSIKTNANTDRTPVIGLFTGTNDDNDTNYDAWLTAPLNAADVVRWVISVLKHETLAQPVAPAPAAVPPPTVTANKVSAAKILVAEDSTVLQQMLQMLFDRLGCSIDMVSNGKAAVEAAEQGNYSMIFMDWQMPEMDGLQATKAIRQNQQAADAHTPIIAMTANAMQGDRDTCLAAGMDDYISKPFTFEELKTLVNRWLPESPPTATK